MSGSSLLGDPPAQTRVVVVFGYIAVAMLSLKVREGLIQFLPAAGLFAFEVCDVVPVFLAPTPTYDES